MPVTWPFGCAQWGWEVAGHCQPGLWCVTGLSIEWNAASRCRVLSEEHRRAESSPLPPPHHPARQLLRIRALACGGLLTLGKEKFPVLLMTRTPPSSDQRTEHSAALPSYCLPATSGVPRPFRGLLLSFLGLLGLVLLLICPQQDCFSAGRESLHMRLVPALSCCSFKA